MVAVRQISFLEENRAIQDGCFVREKSAVLAEIEKLNRDHKISDYLVKAGDRAIECTITLTDEKKIRILLDANDKTHAALLANKLKLNEVKKEEAYIFIEEQDAFFAKNVTEEKNKKQPFPLVMDYLLAMQHNGEIQSVIKREEKEISYVVETKENEKITVLVHKENKEAIASLDQLQKNAVKKTNPHKIVLIATMAAAAIVMATPYVKATIPQLVDNYHAYHEKQDTQLQIENNFMRMKSYSSFLRDGLLTRDDYMDFIQLVSVTKTYYEENNMTNQEDYQQLLQYEELLNNYYPSIRRGL